MFRKVSMNSVDKGIAFLPGEGLEEKLHDHGVGIEPGERLPIGFPPGAQQETFGFNHGFGPVSLRPC